MTTMMRPFLCLLIPCALFHLSVRAQTAEDQCDLVCYHNETCVKGDADFSDHPKPNGQAFDFHERKSSPNGYHCQCEPGKTGLRCGRTYRSCNDGQHKCYHGGKCIDGLEDEFGNDHLFCDCNGAVDENGVEYVGKYCQIPKPMPCGDDPLFPEAFCVNGGYCKADFRDSPHVPCRCGPYHEGKHCEFDAGEVPECTLDCQNGGHCKLGIHSYGEELLNFSPNFEQNTNDFQYCDCPDGFYGAMCEITSSTCGDHHCFHGATCVQPDAHYDSKYCDCTTAHTDETSYAGQYCQYAATSYCSDDPNKRGHAFCTNNGTCHPDGDHFDCTCPQGYSGPQCEVHQASEGPVQDCVLDCQNGGQCRKGAKDLKHLKDFDFGPVSNMMNVSFNGNFEHCVCPTGFAGLECEIKAEICGEREHVCFHGSKCIKDEDEHGCDCANAFTPFERYEGRYCEFKSSEICTVDGLVGTGNNNFAFCVNGGKCKGISSTNEFHKGCTCPPGFTGNHCEITKELDRQQNSSGKGMEAVAISFISLFSVAAVVAAIAAFLLWKRRREASNRAPSMEPTAYNGPIDSHAVHMDFGVVMDPWENTELHSVDLT